MQGLKSLRISRLHLPNSGGKCWGGVPKWESGKDARAKAFAISSGWNRGGARRDSPRITPGNVGPPSRHFCSRAQRGISFSPALSMQTVVPQVRVRSLHDNLGEGTLVEVRLWSSVSGLRSNRVQPKLCCGASSTHVSVRERREHGAPGLNGPPAFFGSFSP